MVYHGTYRQTGNSNQSLRISQASRAANLEGFAEEVRGETGVGAK
jgi:hypothetical protein